MRASWVGWALFSFLLTENCILSSSFDCKFVQSMENERVMMILPEKQIPQAGKPMI